MTRWIVHGERSLYESDWMSLRLVDVELPDGTRFEHHVLRMPREAAAAVVFDPERGGRPGPLRPIGSYHPATGSVDQRFHLFLAEGASYEGEPADRNEAERIEWVPVERVRELIRAGQVTDGYTLTGLLWAFELGLLDQTRSAAGP